MKPCVKAADMGWQTERLSPMMDYPACSRRILSITTPVHQLCGLSFAYSWKLLMASCLCISFMQMKPRLYRAFWLEGFFGNERLQELHAALELPALIIENTCRPQVFFRSKGGAPASRDSPAVEERGEFFGGNHERLELRRDVDVVLPRGDFVLEPLAPLRAKGSCSPCYSEVIHTI